MPFIMPDTTAAAWKLAPLAVAWPGHGPGLAVAVFGELEGFRRKLPFVCDPTTHVLTVALTRCQLEFSCNGRPVHLGPVEPGAVEIMRAGHQGEATISGDWRFLQIYLPAALVPAAATEVGVSFEQAAALELIGMGFAGDPVLATIGFALARRLERGETPQRLELDELGVSLAEYLVLRHSNAAPPRKPQLLLKNEQLEALAAMMNGLELDLLNLAELFDQVMSTDGGGPARMDQKDAVQIAGRTSKRERLQ